MPTTNVPHTDRRNPKMGDAIHVDSAPWGREQGVCYEATVTGVDASNGLITASVEVPESGTAPGDPGMSTSAGIAGESDQWHWPEKG